MQRDCLARVANLLELLGSTSHSAGVPRLDTLEASLDALEREGLLRRPDVGAKHRELLLACSNDYLGLGREPVSRETIDTCFSGAGASRLIRGTYDEHVDLERKLAEWVGKPSALLFSSGYAANVGLISALCESGAFIVSDALNHASIIDGCRLSRAERGICRHLDVDHVEYLLRRQAAATARWVIVESYYSMDGDTPDLAALRSVCDRLDAFLVVDEAHALGVFGPKGSGLCAASRTQADVVVGTLGKAVGVSGAFVAGSQSLCAWLWNRARSFVFSTAPPPFLASFIAARLSRVMAADAARAQLLGLSARLRAHLQAAGAPVLDGSHGPIVPVVIGDSIRALKVANAMLEEGVAVQAIRPPTVPAGSARLRATVNATMSPADLEQLVRALSAALAMHPP